MHIGISRQGQRPGGNGYPKIEPVFRLSELDMPARKESMAFTALVIGLCIFSFIFYLAQSHYFKFNSHTFNMYDLLLRMAEGKALPLLSENIGLFGFYGALLYYLLLPVFIVSRSLFTLYFINLALLTISGFLLFLLAREIGGKKMGLVTYLVWSILFIYNMKYPHVFEPEQQTFLVFFTMLFYLSLVRSMRDRRYFLLSTLSLAVIMQTHASGFLSPLAYLYVGWKCFGRRIRYLSVNLAILAFLSFPYLIEISQVITSHLRTAESLPPVTFSLEPARHFFSNYYVIVNDPQLLMWKVVQAALAAFFFIGLIMLAKRAWRAWRIDEKNPYSVILIWLAAGTFMLLLFPGDLFNPLMHFSYVLPASVIIISFGICGLADIGRQLRHRKAINRAISACIILLLAATLVLEIQDAGLIIRSSRRTLASHTLIADYMLNYTGNAKYRDMETMLIGYNIFVDTPGFRNLLEFRCIERNCTHYNRTFPYSYKFVAFSDAPHEDVEVSDVRRFGLVYVGMMPQSLDYSNIYSLELNSTDISGVPPDHMPWRHPDSFPIYMGFSFDSTNISYYSKVLFYSDESADGTLTLKNEGLIPEEIFLNNVTIFHRDSMESSLLSEDPTDGYWQRSVFKISMGEGANTLCIRYACIKKYSPLTVFNINIIRNNS